MRTRFQFFIALVCTFTLLYACNDDEHDVKKTNITLTIANPADLVNFENLKLGNWTVTFAERNTGKQESFNLEDNTLIATLPEGDYRISGERPITYDFAGKEQSGKLYFSEESKVIIGEAISITANAFPQTEYIGKDGGFVIQEVFYVGTATPEGKAYKGDKYIKLYNNTDKTLYADGLFIAVTQRNSAIAYTYTPDIIDKAVPVSNIILIPGDGTTYPVEPGKSFVLAESAVDHTKENVNSVDLSTKVNMEWANPHLLNQPANNPNIPDATLVYNFFSLHMNGLTSILIGRLEVSQEQYLKDYVYEYSWKTIINGKEYERGPFSDYKIPNEWVMDAVYTSVEGKAEVPVFSPSIDMGWTYCGAYFNDVERFGKSVIRKVLYTAADGREVLMDTNNSAKDFTPNSKPSLLK